MLAAERMSSDTENTPHVEDQLAVTMAFQDNSQQEEENDTLEALEETESVSSCEDTWTAPQPEQMTAEQQFSRGVEAPQAETKPEDSEGKMETWLSVQKYTDAESVTKDASPGETTEKESEPVQANVTDGSEEVASVSGEGYISSAEAGGEPEEHTVLSETPPTDTAEAPQTDKEADDTGDWVAHSEVPCESSEPAEAASSESG